MKRVFLLTATLVQVLHLTALPLAQQVNQITSTGNSASNRVSRITMSNNTALGTQNKTITLDSQTAAATIDEEIRMENNIAGLGDQDNVINIGNRRTIASMTVKAFVNGNQALTGKQQNKIQAGQLSSGGFSNPRLTTFEAQMVGNAANDNQTNLINMQGIPLSFGIGVRNLTALVANNTSPEHQSNEINILNQNVIGDLITSAQVRENAALKSQTNSINAGDNDANFQMLNLVQKNIAGGNQNNSVNTFFNKGFSQKQIDSIIDQNVAVGNQTNEAINSFQNLMVEGNQQLLASVNQNIAGGVQNNVAKNSDIFGSRAFQNFTSMALGNRAGQDQTNLAINSKNQISPIAVRQILASYVGFNEALNGFQNNTAGMENNRAGLVQNLVGYIFGNIARKQDNRVIDLNNIVSAPDGNSTVEIGIENNVSLE